MPHRKNKKRVRDKFSAALKAASLEKCGNKISPTSLANSFNLRASGTTVITRQTASKWLKGEALPDHGHMVVLVRWLQLNLNDIYSIDDDFPDSDKRLSTPPTNGSV